MERRTAPARDDGPERADNGPAGDATGLPGWVPEAARHYLAHVTTGAPLRALARDARVHASTILRQVRRLESLRDDPLVDEALHDLARHLAAPGPGPASPHRNKKESDVTPAEEPASIRPALSPPAPPRLPPAEARILREGARVLRRLNEARTVLAVARDMEMGVVVREGPDGAPERLAVVARDIAQAMALKDWIACTDPAARVIRYRITATGRAELRRIAMAAAPGAARDEGQAEGAARGAPGGDRMLRHMRSLLGDSPLTALARRQTRDGRPWLPRDLVAAGERLREDFELSQSGPRVTLDWESFVAASRSPAGLAPADLPPAAREARERLVGALAALGPGLADAALRCCCYLEGLETVEDRMGWSARSGKVVLRIALLHLQRHYARTLGPWAPPIG